jgi:very-short-patch-repair endonuclease
MALGTLGIVTLAELEAHGYRRTYRERLVTDGRLVRIRNGWFALPEARRDAVRATRAGGRLTCGAALRAHGVWVLDDDRVHVAVRGNASRLRDPDDRRRPWSARRSRDVVLHWDSTSQHRRSPIVSVEDALAQLVGCAPFESALASLDSALNLGLVTLTWTTALLGGTRDGERLRRAVDRSAESGTETIARVRLRRRGLRVRTQVRIAGVGRVDMIIGDRLVLEIDSRTHHLGKNYEEDRRRDLELVRQGFIVIRASYRTVLEQWPLLERAVLDIVERGDHLRRGRDLRRGLAITV